MRGYQGGRRVAFALAAAVSIFALGAGQAAASGSTLYVSPHGSDAGGCTHSNPCQTIGHAVSVAAAGDRIVVRHGTYAESVVLTKRLHLVGRHWPAVDATGQQNGIVLAGAGASGSSVRGFKVENADQEGILAMQTSWIRIVHNAVVHNDQGMFAANPTGECAAFGEVPGDCGEGVRLMTVTHSRVTANRITRNSGGVLRDRRARPDPPQRHLVEPRLAKRV